MTTIFPINEFRNQETPFYYYDTTLLENTFNEIKQCIDGYPFKVHYAVKANANPKILSIIKNSGFGIDCVSGGELKASLDAGFNNDYIVFAGVAKTDKEIIAGLDANIMCFNVESKNELEVINDLAKLKGKIANIAIRVNPNIDAHTHHYITTGLSENKFGIDLALLDNIIKYALQLKNINLCGLHFHIGSQILSLEPFEMLCKKINELQERMIKLGAKISIINVGGGLGIDYDNPDDNLIPPFKAYFDTFKKHLVLRNGQQLHFELGRAIVAQCGTLITQVIYVKEGVNKKFVMVDAGMTDLLRPALYQAHHKIENITSTEKETDIYDVVGPICETSDSFGSNETLPITKRGDLIALRSAGAYGEVMASQYNCRKLPSSLFKP
ncbi:MAG: diaminopimelate decarboxylase [Muribaculaceae bacterium]